MFNISYDLWKEVVDLYFEIPQKYKKFSLQLYPFYRKENKIILKSECFFKGVIENGYFVQVDSIMQVGHNFMQRQDGSFRDTQLLSPILFLLLETIGLNIFKGIDAKENRLIEAYHSGNYQENSVHYRNNYVKFYSRIEDLAKDFDRYVKIDIKNFFPSINLNILFNQTSEKNTKLTEVDYFFMRKFLLYLGEGKYPIIENSTALSYLATMIYLEKSDDLLSKYLNELDWIDEWKAVRFVDDLYVFYNSNIIDNSTNVWELVKKYSDILFEFELKVNISKVSHDTTQAIYKDVKQTSFNNHYLESTNSSFPESLFTDFLENLSSANQLTWLKTKDYYRIMIDYLHLNDKQTTAVENFHNYLYSKRFDDYFSDSDIQRLIFTLNNIQFISNDVKRLTALILRAKNEDNAKILLNQLFEKSKSTGWTRHDLAIANAYLIQRNVEHGDLLALVKKYDQTLYNYYTLYCHKDLSLWSQKIKDNNTIELERTLNIRRRTEQIYFLYLKSLKSKDWLIAYAYYKSYFDRRTAELDAYSKVAKPNYHEFYEKKNLIKFYCDIQDSKEILKVAHKERGKVPSIHGSAELLAISRSHKELLSIISDLERLIEEKQNRILSNF